MRRSEAKAPVVAVTLGAAMLALTAGSASASEADLYTRYCTSASGVQTCSFVPVPSVAFVPTPLAGTSQFNVAVSAAAGLPSLPATANAARVCVRTAEVETTQDGTAPTSAPRGTAFAAGTCTWLQGRNVLTTFLAISASGTLDVEYFQ